MRNILFCGNSKVFDGVLTCMLSIYKRTETKEPFSISILTMDVSHLNPDYTCIDDNMISFLDKVAKSYNAENEVRKIDVTEIYNKEFANSPNEQCYCSPYTLIRLFADLIPGMPEKFLYLDVDVMFNRDITLLYDIDITDYEYAASPDHYGKYLIRPDYINAGVLLINLTKCRQTGLFEKARNQIKTKKWLFADQDALWHSTTKKKVIAQKFNDQKFLHPKSTVVRHFSKRLFWWPYPHTANIKQYNVTKLHTIFKYDQFDDILYNYIYLKGVYEQQ
ncbi:Glycosyl transferase family 8 [Treponema bryantii]|uniref:Glycosyl transferase family 8 n=1 Tax=Treponema bryantii TaxID=163 RepID=A0A1I3ISW6_9SPIR|nr:glycosyltransferase [Treponema bryantii]SFI51054.1 Glycosyl transferase family 8 [Treponema bryantii]